MTRWLRSPLGCAVLAGLLQAQAPPAALPGPPPAIASAEVAADGSVTFRLRAPKASAVVLNGDWENGRGLAMKRDDSGLWTLTTAPLKPEIWLYTFQVDGATVLDAGNPRVVRDGMRHLNTVLVPGPESALLQPARSAHGSVSAVWYESRSLQAARRMLVYTPPGHESSQQKYPVLYLFHGGGGDEEAWNTMGNASTIMDNLISQGKSKPMIVVMPNANWADAAAPTVTGVRVPSSPGAGGGMDYQRADSDLTGDIAPYIERTYRALSGRENRAIAGLSMGGGISINVGLKRLDFFASVAEFSSGMFGGVAAYPAFDVDKIAPGFLSNAAASNARLKLLFFSCGVDDPRMPFHTKVVEDLRGHGIAMTFKSYPGSHEWRVWRNSLADLAPLLFR